MIPIFVFAYNRYRTMTTSLWLGDLPHTVLCHTEDDWYKFMDGGRLGEGANLYTTNNPRGLAHQRNSALEMMDNGQWAIFIVDDHKAVTYLKDYHKLPPGPLDEKDVLANQPAWRKRFATPMSAKEFIITTPDDIHEAEKRNFNLVGYALTGNPLFRLRQYSTGGLADGRLWLVRRTALRFDPNALLQDDYAWCALNKKHYGGYLINNWIHPEMERYTPGGCGTREERMAEKIAECAYLVKTYPEYIQYADKAGWPPRSHIRLRNTKTTPAQTQLF